jgi:hypothetical protein
MAAFSLIFGTVIYYGQEYGLSYQSELGAGCTAEITVPEAAVGSDLITVGASLNRSR